MWAQRDSLDLSDEQARVLMLTHRGFVRSGAALSGPQEARMKEIKAHTKVLITTGYTVDERLEALLDQGCHGFIQKPFSLHEFSTAVRTILDK